MDLIITIDSVISVKAVYNWFKENDDKFGPGTAQYIESIAIMSNSDKNKIGEVFFDFY